MGLTLLVVLVGFGAIIYVSVTLIGNTRRGRQSWQQLATRTGLTFNPGDFTTMYSVTGEFRNRPLVLGTFTDKLEDSQTTYTRVTLRLGYAAPVTLSLSPEGFFSGISKALGGEDIQIGAERFDESFTIRCNPPEIAQIAFGDPALQEALLAMLAQHSFKLALSEEGWTWTMKGVISDGDFLEQVFNVLSDIADKADGDFATRKSETG